MLCRAWSQMFAIVYLCAAVLPAVGSSRPHIVFILADDLGWNDVSFHGSKQIPTPNLDVLASEGIILHNYYTMQLCTPSRTEYTPLKRGFDSFFGYYTGQADYYDHTSGTDHVGLDLRDNEAPTWGENGTYATYLFTRKFISLLEKHNTSKPFFGYFSHIAPHAGRPVNRFQAPEGHVRKFSYIGDKNRTYYAGMVDAMDESVGAVVDALRRKGMLNDTIIVFSSDNGGALFDEQAYGANNWPLRGNKASLWEGGLRAPAFVWSTRLKQRRRVSRQMMHIVDWLPTLYSAAGGKRPSLGITDGVDMWQALSEGSASPRQEILHNVDPVSAAMALRAGRYKLVAQSPRSNRKDKRYPPKGKDRPVDDLTRLRADSRAAKALELLYGPLDIEGADKLLRDATVDCGPGTGVVPPGKAPYLFDIERDPCEMQNLATTHRKVLRSLFKRLSAYMSYMVPPRTQPDDPRSYPENFGGVWSPWLD